jgi:hypothetical protein
VGRNCLDRSGADAIRGAVTATQEGDEIVDKVRVA